MHFNKSSQENKAEILRVKSPFVLCNLALDKRQYAMDNYFFFQTFNWRSCLKISALDRVVNRVPFRTVWVIIVWFLLMSDCVIFFKKIKLLKFIKESILNDHWKTSRPLLTEPGDKAKCKKNSKLQILSTNMDWFRSSKIVKYFLSFLA